MKNVVILLFLCYLWQNQNHDKMKKFLFAAMAAFLLFSCQESLEDRAAREAQEFNRKFCPQRIDDNSRLDSFTFDKASHTFTRHFTITSADSLSAERAKEKQFELRKALVEEVKSDMNMRVFKENGYSFRFVAHSGLDTSIVLYDSTITKEDYAPQP